MGKFVVLVILLLVAFWLVRRALRARRQGPPPDAGGAAQGELVSCAHCGVHLPRAEARLAVDRVYCSDEHARLGPRQG